MIRPPGVAPPTLVGGVFGDPPLARYFTLRLPPSYAMEVTVYVGGVRRPLPSQTRAYRIHAVHGGPTRQGSLDTGQVAALGCREQFVALPHEGG